MTMPNKGWTGRKILYFAVSILVSVYIWFYVDEKDGRRVDKTIENIPITYVGADTALADRGLMLIEEESDTSVTLQLQGKRRLIAALDPSQIGIQVDLSNVTSTGQQSINYQIIYPGTEFRNNLTVRSAKPYTARVTIGELYRKDVEIRCDIQGTVAEGYIAGEVEFDPGTLEIRGEQDKLDAVSYAKVSLKIDELSQTLTQELDYTLYNAQDEPVDMTGIHATTSQIKVTLPINVSKKLPLKMNFIESPGSSLSNVSYRIEPESVTVFGDAELLKNIDSITLDDFDLSKLTEDTTYSYTIPIPDGVENSSGVSRATLKIRFKDLATVPITVTDISCENIPEGKTVEVLTKEVTVVLRGTSADLAEVSDETVSLIADLKNVDAASGSYTVPARVVVHTGGDVGTTETYQIQVHIASE